jgi:orotidine-5'-phosphate decarboxylase
MIDKLVVEIRKKKNVSLIGLDPTLEQIPVEVKEKYFKETGKTPETVARLYLDWGKAMVDAIEDIVAVIKPQVAFYECLGPEGMATYTAINKYAREKSLLVIGDVKRGDLANTAKAYAAHLGGIDIEGERFDVWNEDAITIQPYMGEDSITPFLPYVENNHKGLFVLVKTSNKSSADIQDITTATGTPLFARVAALLESWGASSIGKEGYSNIAAVVGATHPEQGRALRQSHKNMFFLVPGYGAQGASAADTRGFGDENGQGYIVNSSRGITGAWMASYKNGGLDEVAAAARTAAEAMREELN